VLDTEKATVPVLSEWWLNNPRRYSVRGLCFCPAHRPITTGCWSRHLSFSKPGCRTQTGAPDARGRS